MATSLNRLEFKRQYSKCPQGLFILVTEKRFLKGLPEINMGQQLSMFLCDVEEHNRPGRVMEGLVHILAPYCEAYLTHIEILFTPTLQLDAVRSLLSLCRNRKICIRWPGSVLNDTLLYATPECREYYECDLHALQDTYIIRD